MHALLVAVPASVSGHGAYHQIHAVRRLHKRCVVADIHVVHVRGHLFAVSDLADGRIDGLHILLNALQGVDRKDLPDAFGSAVQNILNIGLADLPAVIVIGFPYHFCQHHCPDKVDRQDIGSVDDGNTGIEGVFLRLGRDQVDADGARPVGVQSRVQDFTEDEIHIGLQIAYRPGLSKKEGYFGHGILSCILSALQLRADSGTSLLACCTIAVIIIVHFAGQT